MVSGCALANCELSGANCECRVGRAHCQMLPVLDNGSIFVKSLTCVRVLTTKVGL